MRSPRTERRCPCALPPLIAALLLICGLALSCSDDGDPGPDSGLDGPDMLDAAAELGSDGATGDGGSGPTCTVSAALVDKVDPARMLKDLNYLVGLGERDSHANQKLAADYLRAELKKIPGLDVTDHGYTYVKDGKSYVNLVATLTGATRPDEYLFMGAHYDSISSNTAQAPGADDNASGTVAVLEAARALAGCKLARTVRLLFFSNEEKGIVGATAYVNSIKATLPANKLLGYLNVDTIAYGPATEDLDLATKPANKQLADDMGAAVEKWTKLKVQKRISDHCG